MSKKLKPGVALKMTLASLGNHFNWSPTILENMVHFLPYKEGDELISSRQRARREGNLEKRDAYIRTLAKERTLRDVIQNAESDPDLPGISTLVKRLIEIGLTRLDTTLLPQGTVTFDMLKRIPREKLLTYEAGVLGTLTDRSLALQRKMLDRESRLTVADILAMRKEEVQGTTVMRTIYLLERLGFGPDDGPLMLSSGDTRRIIVESLKKEDGLTEEEATKFADIAARRNWI